MVTNPEFEKGYGQAIFDLGVEGDAQGWDWSNAYSFLKDRLARIKDALPNAAPIPMFLTCPKCNMRHIDEGAFATKPHHTHSCQSCGLTWRPAVVPTVGVAFLPGFKNEPEPPPPDHDNIRGHA